MIHDGQKAALLAVAEKMVLAAVTAPKGKGIDTLEMAILEKEDLMVLGREMERIGQHEQVPSFLRDAENLREYADLAVLIGTKIQRLNLKFCGLCGYANCEANHRGNGICAFNTGDLGIAIGSAVTVAGHHHADNRIMYTMGMAALSLKLLGDHVKIAYGIPLAAAAKNPFFDRVRP